MAFENMRKLGQIGLVEDVDEYVGSKGLGPDPFAETFGPDDLASNLESRRGTIKGTMMNQEVIAGLGNIYVDEVLFHAGIRPDRKVERISREEIGQISRRISQVLKMAIDRQVDADRFPSSYMLPHRSKEGKCPRCGRPWTRKQISGRTTYYCARDQR